MEPTLNSNKRSTFSPDNITSYWKDQRYYVDSGSFVDEHFPPNDNSIFGKDKHGNFVDRFDGPNKSIELAMTDTEWKRPNEIFSSQHYLLFEEKIEVKDIKQGNIGNCYFLSSLAALCEYPNQIFQIFRTKEVSPNGLYEVVMFIDGVWQIVTVDDYIPVVKGTITPKFARPNGNELWVMILEKAWAKVNGGYANIISGWPSDPLTAFTGFSSEKISHKDMELNNLWNVLSSADSSNCILCTSTKDDPIVEERGLVKNHAYTLIDTREFKYDGKTVRIVKIRNPWGCREWNGDWSDKSPLWNDEAKKICDFTDEEDGTFWMSVEDLQKLYECTHICNIMYDSNIKSFHFKDEDIQTPNVFNLFIRKPSRISISLIRSHWRYNRHLKNVAHPFYLLVAKYDPQTLRMTGVEGSFHSYENVDICREFTEGYYVIWVYCAYKHCKEPRPSEYHVRFVSVEKFRVRLESVDPNFDFLKQMIISGVKEKPNYKPGEQFIAIENQFKLTGIGYRCIINPSETSYQKWTNNASGLVNMGLLLPFEGLGQFDFWVPPKSSAICLAIRLDTYGTYWFNLKSSYALYKCNAGDDPTKTKSVNLERFLSNAVTLDEVDDNYYDYFSNSLSHAKIEVKFKQLNLNEVNMKKLSTEYPDIMTSLISLKPIENDEYLTWGKLKYENGFYVGQLTPDRCREGRGAYCWVNDKITYVGYWVNNIKEKFGYVLDGNYKVTYEGEYKNGMKNGFGKFTFSNGDRHEGNYINDKRSGKGRYIWKDGSRWEGNFINGQLSGVGIFYPSDGSEPYEAEY